MTQSDYARAAGLTRARVSQLVKAGMPLDSVEIADAWRGSGAKRKPHEPFKLIDPELYKPLATASRVDPASVSEDSPQGAYERQKQIERASYGLAVKALRLGTDDAARLVAVHAQAARNLTAAKEEVLRLAQIERRLVSGEWVRNIMLSHDGMVAAIIKSMPKQLAGRILPGNPEHAERELDKWVQEVALKTLSDTDPWKHQHNEITNGDRAYTN